MKDDLEGTIRFIRDFVPTNLPSGRRSNELLIIWRIVPGSYHWSTCFPDAITKKHYRWCDTYSLSGAQTTTQDIILHRGRWTVERGGRGRRSENQHARPPASRQILKHVCLPYLTAARLCALRCRIQSRLWKYAKLWHRRLQAPEPRPSQDDYI